MSVLFRGDEAFKVSCRDHHELGGTFILLTFFFLFLILPKPVHKNKCFFVFSACIFCPPLVEKFGSCRL